jgi:hypothetical protein
MEAFIKSIVYLIQCPGCHKRKTSNDLANQGLGFLSKEIGHGNGENGELN